MRNEDERPKRIRDIESIQNGESIIVETRGDLANVVEEPCLKACYDLYDKNVQTIYSGANNSNDTTAFIGINYDTLDEANKVIADNLVKENKLSKQEPNLRNPFTVITLSIPINKRLLPR